MRDTTVDDARVKFSNSVKEDPISSSKENETRGDRDGTPVLPRYQIDVSCAPSRKMIVFLRTRRKHTPARDTEINAILRGVVTPLATAGVFVSVKHVHSEGTIKSAYVQIERRAASSSFSIRVIKQMDVDRRRVREISR